jgi:hypothetical protein
MRPVARAKNFLCRGVPPFLSVTTSQPLPAKALRRFPSVTIRNRVTDRNWLNPLRRKVCDVVTDGNRGHGARTNSGSCLWVTGGKAARTGNVAERSCVPARGTSRSAVPAAAPPAPRVVPALNREEASQWAKPLVAVVSDNSHPRTVYHHTSTLRTNLLWMSGHILPEGQGEPALHPQLGKVECGAAIRRPFVDFPPLVWFTTQTTVPQCLLQTDLVFRRADGTTFSVGDLGTGLSEADRSNVIALHRLALGFRIADIAVTQ